MCQHNIIWRGYNSISSDYHSRLKQKCILIGNMGFLKITIFFNTAEMCIHFPSVIDVVKCESHKPC